MSTFRLSSKEGGDRSAVGDEHEMTPGAEGGPRGLFSCDDELGSLPQEGEAGGGGWAPTWWVCSV